MKISIKNKEQKRARLYTEPELKEFRKDVDDSGGFEKYCLANRLITLDEFKRWQIVVEVNNYGDVITCAFTEVNNKFAQLETLESREYGRKKFGQIKKLEAYQEMADSMGKSQRKKLP